MIHKASENFDENLVANVQTLNNSSNSVTYKRLRNYHNFFFLIITGTLAGGASLTCQMRQRIGSAGTEANLGSSGTITSSNSITMVEGKSEDLTVGSLYDRVGMLLTETGSQNAEVTVILVRYNSRYPQNSLPTT